MQGFRKFLRGTGGKVLLAVIIIPFVITAFYGYFTGGGGPQEVAKVEGTPVYWEQVRNEAARLRDNVSSQIPGIDEQGLQAFVPTEMGLEPIINERLAAAHIERLKLNVSEEAVAASLVQYEEFQENGRFSAAALERFARGLGYTTSGFLNMLAQSELKNQWTTGLLATDFALPNEVGELTRLVEQERDVEFAVIELDKLAENYTITDAQVADYYAENSDRYILPEHFTLDYLQLRREDVATEVTVTEAEIKNAYDIRQQNFDKNNAGSERRSVAHIYFDLDSNEEAVETQAATIKARLQEGEITFAEAAQEYSQDLATASQGGSFGLLAKADLPESLSDVAFSLAEGEVSELVKSKEGYHLLLVEEIQDQRRSLAPYEELKAELEREIRDIKAEGILFDKVALLEELAFEHADLVVPAEEVGVELKTTEPFSLANPIPGFEQAAVANELDNSSVREGRHNSRLLEVGQGDYLVFHVKHIEPATPIPLAEVEAQIRTDLARTLAEAALVDNVAELKAAIEEGSSFDELVANAEAEKEEAKGLKRYDENVRQDLVEFVFSLQRGASDQMLAVGQLANGDMAIAHVSEVRDGLLDEETKAIMPSLLAQLGQAESQHTQQLLNASLRESGKVKVYSERIEAHLAEERQLYD